MSDNPYEAPKETSESSRADDAERDELRTVAKAQRRIILCILTYIVVFIGQAMLAPRVPPEIGALSLVVVGLVAAFFTFRLAISLYGVVLGVLFGILTMVPLLGFLLLVLVNQRATTKLQLAGIKVGFLGVKPDTI